MYQNVNFYLSIVFGVLCGIGFVLICLKDIHIVQLEHYTFTKMYQNYLENKKNRLIELFNLALIFLGLLFIAMLIIYNNINHSFFIVYEIIYLAALVLYYFNTKDRNVITPLKFTSKVKRLIMAIFIVYSFLYIAIGFSFYFTSYKWFVIFMPFLFLLQPLILHLCYLLILPIEKLITKRFIYLAHQKLKKMPNLKIIGITGSYGKTSVKFMLTTILKEKFATLCTPHSYNTAMGITKTINGMLMPFHEVLVVEMGADHLNDIKKLCKIVKPQISIITSVGNQHLNTFKTIDNIIKTKYQIVESLDKNGIAIFNTSCNIGKNYYQKCKCQKFAVNVNGNNLNSTTYAKNNLITENGIVCDAVVGNKLFHLKTKLLGEHNIGNLLIAITVADILGVEQNLIEYAVSRIKPVEHRLELKKGNLGEIVLDDSFNSNKLGAKYAVDTLAKFSQIKIIITPGIVELGKEAYEVNYELGKTMGKVADFIYVVKEVNKKAILDGLAMANFDCKKVKCVNTFVEARIDLNKYCNDNYVVLIENDLPDNYD